MFPFGEMMQHCHNLEIDGPNSLLPEWFISEVDKIKENILSRIIVPQTFHLKVVWVGHYSHFPFLKLISIHSFQF